MDCTIVDCTTFKLNDNFVTNSLFYENGLKNNVLNLGKLLQKYMPLPSLCSNQPTSYFNLASNSIL